MFFSGLRNSEFGRATVDEYGNTYNVNVQETPPYVAETVTINPPLTVTNSPEKQVTVPVETPEQMEERIRLHLQAVQNSKKPGGKGGKLTWEQIEERRQTLNQNSSGNSPATNNATSDDNLIFGFEPKTLLFIGGGVAVLAFVMMNGKGK
jgi:hypothetical protein